MATTSSSPTDDPPETDQAVRSILANDQQLANAAYYRTHGYRRNIQQAVNTHYDLSIRRDDVRDAVLEAKRLGLLSEWAELDD
jgi:hypothetical protein